MQRIFQQRLCYRPYRRLYHDIKITTLSYSHFEKLKRSDVGKPEYITIVEPVHLYTPGIYFPEPDLWSYRAMWEELQDDPEADKNQLKQHPFYIANHKIYTHYLKGMRNDHTFKKCVCNDLQIKNYSRFDDLTNEIASFAVRKCLIFLNRRDPWFATLVLNNEKLSYESVRNFLKQDKNIVDKLDMCGGTLLKSAVYCGFTTVIKLLIDNGANINHPCDLDNTVLHIAAIKGDFHIVKVLLDLGINKELKNRNGNTALCFAKMLHEQIQLIPPTDNMATEREYARIISVLEKY